jgi:hypothetical protein
MPTASIIAMYYNGTRPRDGSDTWLASHRSIGRITKTSSARFTSKRRTIIIGPDYRHSGCYALDGQ